MLKTKRRVEITVFRCQRLVTTDAAEQTSQPSTTEDEGLVAEVVALVNRLTGTPSGNLRKKVKQESIRIDDDSDSDRN